MHYKSRKQVKKYAADVKQLVGELQSNKRKEEELKKESYFDE